MLKVGRPLRTTYNLYFAEPENCCGQGTRPLQLTVAIWYTYLESDWLKPPFVIFDIGAL